jgi:hypothetical protein
MKNSEKKLQLISYGLKPSTVTKLNESQVDALYQRLSESKKETKEDWTKKVSQETEYVAPIASVSSGKGLQVPPPTDPSKKSMISVAGGNVKVTQAESEMTEGELDEKFESKSQQGLMWARCKKSTGEQKEKWCKLAKEFSKSTTKKDYEKMPEKKHPEKTVKKLKEEGGYMDMIGKAFNKNMQNKIADIKPGLKWESELEKQFSQIIESTIFPKMTKKDFIKTLMESPEVAPEKERTKEKERETEKERRRKDEDDPFRPGRRNKPKPAPKADTEVAPEKERTKEIERETEKERRKKDQDDPFRPGKRNKPKPAPKAETNEGSLPDWLSSRSIGIK